MGPCDNIIGITIRLIILVTWIFGSGVISEESETISMRPTRPKMMSDTSDMRKLLDVVREYYTVNSKARYGKRGVIPAIIVHDRPHTRVIIDSLMKTLESVKDKYRERENGFKKDNKTTGSGQKRDYHHHHHYHNSRDKRREKKNHINIGNQIHTRILFNSVLRRWLYNLKIL